MKKIIILAGQYNSTEVIYNYLKDSFFIEKVIREKGVSRKNFLLKRIKRNGVGKVIGQIIFKLTIVPYLNLFSKKRISSIKNKFNLSLLKIENKKLINVDSVNSDEVIKILRDENPDVIVINGTRIISEKVLTCCQAKFINMHAGITPKYRGSHGAYWALAERDKENCGVTIHYVDKGIDTGKIISRTKIIPEAKDNFVTYPWLQLSQGLPLLKKAIEDTFEGKVIPKETGSDSRLWSHPTVIEYLKNRIKYGIK